ncbi:FAD-dependent monooxygenase [Kutzneria sp. NPDC052558]|uniref:FAD-dependent monooxygenase n=1 Tax=Kutzneria sp. NPDC052558 TaxID=3364121 RepID=UPI0037C596C8
MAIKVIISGAGVAGLALTHWLARVGATTVTVEKASEFRPVGHYISLKGNGVEMVRRMGVEQWCEQRAAPLEELRMFTADGRFIRNEHTAALSKALGGYILFRRADLQEALYGLVRARADIRFGVHIGQVEAGPDGVAARLSDGTVEHADLLVGADGIHSHVRGLVFGDGFEKPLGGHYITTTQRIDHGLPPVMHSYLSVGKMMTLYPVAPDVVSAVAYVGEAAGAPPRVGVREYLLDSYAEFPDAVRNVVSAITPGDFVFSDVIAQIEMPRATGDRCALVGDAAHCPTFLSGMGSSLALQDAHVLAGCLARDPGDLPAALTRYEAMMAPIARRYRESARSAHALFLTQSRIKAKVRDIGLRLAPDRVFERQARTFIAAEQPLADLPVGGGT